MVAPEIRALNEVSDAYGVDVSRPNRLQTRGHFPVRLTTWSHRVVGEERSLFPCDLREESTHDDGWDVEFHPAEAATADGIVARPSLDLGGGGEIGTHHPEASHWIQTFIPFREPVQVDAARPLIVRLAITDDVALTASLS